ncbi:signal recognition particle receptor subunit alpha [Pancytospora epiphaga]|nr:signal recognition particle receptor subunit alpha [Pancytospora epiphaga]
MQYFIIFNKKGIVYYEKGTPPSYINQVIQSINPKILSGSKNIRDDVLEYEIEGQVVYLSVGQSPGLQSLLPKYRKAVSKMTEFGNIREEDLYALETENTEEEIGKQKKETPKPNSLDFSDAPYLVPSSLDNTKNSTIKRVFSLFSKKINIDDLGHTVSERLIKKNVDPTFSGIITNDIVSDFKSAGVSVVTEAEFKDKMNATLRKIVPGVDHESFIRGIKEHRGVYSICFVGVNGVGKSTSLAKIACWLLRHDLRVYIAACDTFRAGAIEQLKVHVDRFKAGGHGVGFFESGYSKDDASVAKSAIIRAEREGYDVVLIDTAGRMHNKEHLMKSLSKLVRLSCPNHILFVGEALTGGDSLSYIKEFNRWIGEGVQGRKIDSILLTKIDTVGDKIGQALNLSFSATAPILFLGVGQGNSDLVPMDSELIGDLLTS